MERSSNSFLSVSGLSCLLGGRAVLQGLDLEAGRGEFIGLIGPNGAGKTTLLRLLDGLLPSAGGRILLEGRPLAGLRARERARRIAFMPQNSLPAFSLPVLDVLLFGRYSYQRLFQRASSADLEKAVRMLAYVGLAGFEDRSFAELSGGERQLVLFAQVLMQEAPLILLDEPTSNLDLKHEDQIFSMAAELAAEKRAVIAAVHGLNTAARFCSSLVLLDRGRIAARGAPGAVLKAEILDAVYGVKTRTGVNPLTGSVEVSVMGRRGRPLGVRVHLIGGAGSAVNLTRALYRQGYRLSGGIAHSYDSDQQLWSALGIETRCVEAFSPITEQDVAAAEALVTEAEATVLCCFPIGPGNLGNLRLAEKARNLLIVREEAGELRRSLFSPEAAALLARLKDKSREVGAAELLERLPTGSAGDKRDVLV